MARVRELTAEEVEPRVHDAMRQRPDLDFGMMPIYFQLKRIVFALDQPRERFAEFHKLKVSDVGLLLVLRRGGQGFSMRPTDLYRQMLVTSGTLTKQIDKLEKRHFVRRIDGNGDGRSVRVQLTSKGHKVADQLWTLASDMLASFEVGAGISGPSRSKLTTMLSNWADAAEEASKVSQPRQGATKATASAAGAHAKFR